MAYNKIIGILGGMGPYATIEIYKLILDSVKVEKESEFPHVVITSNPQMPSRVRAFLFNEESPVRHMIKEAKRLEKAGVDFIVIPCNSAHYFLPEVKKEIETEILNMIEITSKHIAEKFPNIKKVAVLGSEIINRTDIYDKELEKNNIEVIKPERDEEPILRKGIDMIKHNKIEDDGINSFTKLTKKMIDRGAEAIILACTEFSILFKKMEINVPIIDTNTILAEYALKKAEE